jgi:hypothetical protein
MAVKRETWHSAVFDGKERAAAPNDIGGGVSRPEISEFQDVNRKKKLNNDFSQL